LFEKISKEKKFEETDQDIKCNSFEKISKEKHR